MGAGGKVIASMSRSCQTTARATKGGRSGAPFALLGRPERSELLGRLVHPRRRQHVVPRLPGRGTDLLVVVDEHRDRRLTGQPVERLDLHQPRRAVVTMGPQVQLTPGQRESAEPVEGVLAAV